MCHRQGTASAPCNLDSRFSFCRGGQGNGREFNINYTFIPLPDHKFLSGLRGMELFPPNHPILLVFSLLSRSFLSPLNHLVLSLYFSSVVK